MLGATITFQYNRKEKTIEVPAKYPVWQAALIYAKNDLQIPSFKKVIFTINNVLINENYTIAFFMTGLSSSRFTIKISPKQSLDEIVADLMKKLTAQEMIDLSDKLAEKSAEKAANENKGDEANNVISLALDIYDNKHKN